MYQKQRYAVTCSDGQSYTTYEGAIIVKGIHKGAKRLDSSKMFKHNRVLVRLFPCCSYWKPNCNQLNFFSKEMSWFL